MTERSKSPSKWILIISGVFAVLELMVSIALWFAPESFLEMVDLNARGVDYVVRMWAVRQFALGVIFMLATWKKSYQMLTICYVFLFVMFAGDVLVGIAQHDRGLVVSGVAMCLIAGAMVYAINRQGDSQL